MQVSSPDAYYDELDNANVKLRVGSHNSSCTSSGEGLFECDFNSSIDANLDTTYVVYPVVSLAGF